MIYKNFGEFVAALDRWGAKPALTIKPMLRTEVISYKQLRKNAYRAAHFLQSRGLKSGQHIMIVAPNRPEWVELYLGAQLLGVVVVPVDASSSLRTVQTFAEQTKPKLIVRGKHVLQDLDKQFDTVVLDELPDLLADQPAAAPKIDISGDTVSTIVFTSGTTAAPKGVVLTQQNILANIEGLQDTLPIQSYWRFLSILPLSHMYELTAGCLTLLHGGCSIYYVPHISPSAIARALKAYRIVAMMAVPQVLELFLRRIQQTATATGQRKQFEKGLKIAAALPIRLRRLVFRKVLHELGGSLEFIITGGAPIPSDVASTWERMGVKTLQGYGLTETSPVLTMNTLKKRRFDSPGRTLPNVEVRIGEQNEIEAKGPSIFRKYLHNREATKAAFTKDGWFKTGDIGSFADGYLRIQGRAKFAIVLASGLKVFPEDVEAAVDKNKAFKELCIVGVTRPSGEEVHAVVVSDHTDKQIDTAIKETNGRLESFQHITNWTRWPEAAFPRTRLLKIDRKTVQAWANKQREANAKDDAVAANADTLTMIIRLVLEKPKLLVQDGDKLSDLGLDSLRRLAVVSMLEEHLGVSVGEASITQHTTVAELRKLINTGNRDDHAITRPRWPYRKLWHMVGNGLRESVLRGVLRIWVHECIGGRENLKHLKTPAIFIFNHVDGFDVPVIYNALPHRLRSHMAIAFADDILGQNGLKGLIPRLCFAAFNFARKEPYLPSLEYVGHLVDQGWNIAIAPEGKLSLDGKMQPFKSGIGLLAVEMDVPVVPIKTEGLHGVMPLAGNRFPKKRATVTVRIGKPITIPRGSSYDAATHILEKALKEL
jgi:long-chain acyl-CoA synthetase